MVIVKIRRFYLSFYYRYNNFSNELLNKKHNGGYVLIWFEKHKGMSLTYDFDFFLNIILAQVQN